MSDCTGTGITPCLAAPDPLNGLAQTVADLREHNDQVALAQQERAEIRQLAHDPRSTATLRAQMAAWRMAMKRRYKEETK